MKDSLLTKVMVFKAMIWSMILTSHVSFARETYVIPSNTKSPFYILQDDKFGHGHNMMLIIAHMNYFNSTGHSMAMSCGNHPGFLTKYFAPPFPVFDDHATLYAFRNKNKQQRPVEMLHSNKLRKKIRGSFPVSGLDGYNWFLKESCSGILRFNKKTTNQVYSFMAENNIPDFLRKKNSVSVGFHVRRGDKIKGESRLYTGIEYVDKLENVTGTTMDKKKIENCFVASDDIKAVDEVRIALSKNGFICKVHTLTQRDEHGAHQSVNVEKTFELIAELFILSKVTYFIGTFNSNIGSIVSLMRGCHTRDRTHLYQSYGVDSDTFSWR